MSTHRAAVHPEANKPYEVKQVPTPKPTPSQVLIQITATAINPVDWKIVDGGFPAKFPAVLGSDAAGIVSKVGDGVKSLSVGDRVYFQGTLGSSEGCTFQEYAVMEEALVSKTPDNISDGEGSGVQLASMAAVVGLYDKSGAFEVKPAPWEKGGNEAGKGQALVILGGSSSVGQYAIQLARLSGFSKIITTSSSSHVDHLKALGATDVVDRSSTTDDFLKIAGNLPLNAVYDAIGSEETLKQGTSILEQRHKGTDHVSHYVTVIPPRDEFENNVTRKSILGVGYSPDLHHVSHPFVKAISGNEGWVGKGLFKPNRTQKVEGGLQKGLQEALDLNKKGVSGVKLWIDPRE